MVDDGQVGNVECFIVFCSFFTEFRQIRALFALGISTKFQRAFKPTASHDQIKPCSQYAANLTLIVATTKKQILE
jgi:hypothetical protein